MLIRQLHHKRIPNYKGWWTLILETPQQKHTQPEIVKGERMPIPIPTESTVNEPIPNIQQREEQEKPKFVYLQGAPVQLPLKPPPPENCCMSGCAHCVWDIYQEDMEEYQEKKNSVIQRFQEAGQELPNELQKKDNSDPLEDMDPTMKAFLAMEKKLKG